MKTKILLITTSLLCVLGLNAQLKVTSSGNVGKQLKSYSLHNKGEGSIEINAGEFYPGMFTYALIVNGVLVDSKKMILTK